jgi:hypothetical protein
MKKSLIFMLTTIFIGISAYSFAIGPGQMKNKQNQKFIFIINNFPNESLSKAEKDSLLFMLEEEKLAHDVYISIYKKWNLQVFHNISRAEQTHMDIVKTLLHKYNIKYSISEDLGSFNNKELESLYNKLISKSNKSIKDALIVGATIEDVDINDLENYLKNTDNKDIAFAYKNLAKGSRNHMRAFVLNLKQYGESYKPQFITQKDFEKIISSPHERGIIY